VTFRVLWAINKILPNMRNAFHEIINKLNRMEQTEKDDLLREQIKRALDIILCDGTAYDERNFEEKEPTDTNDSTKILKEISEWKGLEYTRRHEVLKNVEEIYDSMAGRGSSFGPPNSEKDEKERKEIEKESKEKALAMEMSLIDAMGKGNSNILFAALKDREDFIRYRAAGVLHRVILRIQYKTMTEPESVFLKYIDNRIILNELRRAYAAEKNAVVGCKIMESIYLCRYAVAGLILDDVFSYMAHTEKLQKTLNKNRKSSTKA